MAGFMNEIASRCANFTSGTSWSFLQDATIMSLITGDDMTSKSVNGYHLSVTLENNLGPYFNNVGSTRILTASDTGKSSHYLNFPAFGLSGMYIDGSWSLSPYATYFVDYAFLDPYGGHAGSLDIHNATSYGAHIPIIRSWYRSSVCFACMLCNIRVKWSNNSSNQYYRIIYDGCSTANSGGTIYCGILYNFNYNIKSINVDGVVLFKYNGGTGGFSSNSDGLQWFNSYFSFSKSGSSIPTTYQNSNHYWGSLGTCSSGAGTVTILVNQKNSNLT